MKEYKFCVVFKDSFSPTYYTIPIKGSESYTDALIMLVRLASTEGEIVSIMKEKD